MAPAETITRVAADGTVWEFPPMGHPGCPSLVSVEEKLDDLLSLAGETVRLVSLSGQAANTGLVTTERVGVHTCAYIGRRMIGGEMSGVARIEVKGDNGRYSPVKVYGQTYQEWRDAR